MVKKRYRQELRRLEERLGRLDVRLARLRIAGRVVVRDHDGVCAPADGLLEDLSRMHHRPIHRAAEDDERIGERVHLRVKHQHAEVLLPIVRAKHTPEDAIAVLDFRYVQFAFVLIASGVLAAHQLERRREFHPLGLADAEDLRVGVLLVVHFDLPLEGREFGADEMSRTAERGNQPMRQREHVAAELLLGARRDERATMADAHFVLLLALAFVLVLVLQEVVVEDFALDHLLGVERVHHLDEALLVRQQLACDRIGLERLFDVGLELRDAGRVICEPPDGVVEEQADRPDDVGLVHVRRREVDALLEHPERFAPVGERGGMRLDAFGHPLGALEVVADDLAAPLRPGRLSVGDALELHVADEDAIEEERDVGTQVLERHAVAFHLVRHLLDRGEDVLPEVDIPAEFRPADQVERHGLALERDGLVRVEPDRDVARFENALLDRVLERKGEFLFIPVVVRQERFPGLRIRGLDELRQLAGDEEIVRDDVRLRFPVTEPAAFFRPAEERHDFLVLEFGLDHDLQPFTKTLTQTFTKTCFTLFR